MKYQSIILYMIHFCSWKRPKILVSLDWEKKVQNLEMHGHLISSLKKIKRKKSKSHSSLTCYQRQAAKQPSSNQTLSTPAITHICMCPLSFLIFFFCRFEKRNRGNFDYYYIWSEFQTIFYMFKI